MRFEDVNIDFDRFYKLAKKFCRNYMDGYDAVHTAWIQLTCGATEFNDEEHVNNYFAMRVISNCKKATGRETIHKKNVTNLIDVYYRNTSSIKDWESNYDANKMLAQLELMSDTQARVFKAMLDSTAHGDSLEACKELGMSLNTFKQHRFQLRKSLTNQE